MEFLAPHFLWLGLLALSIPIFIHFLSRERLKLVSFTLTRFILPSKRRITRFSKFQHWWLFLLRALIILLIALALSHPLLKSLAPPAEPADLAAEHKPSVVIVLDDSASMGWKINRKTLFDLAKLRILKILKNYAPLTQFTLLTSSNPDRIILQDSRIEILREKLGELKLSFSKGNPPEAIRLGTRILRTSSEKPGARSGDLVVMSDFQATDWNEFSLQQLSEISAGINFIPIRIGPGKKPNMSIIAVEQDSNLLANQPFKIWTKVCNGSPFQVTKTLYLRISREQQAEKEITLNAHEKKWVSFSVSCAEEGPQQGVVSFKKNDAFALDDQYYFSFSVRSKIKVLLFGEKIEDNHYLKYALNPFSEKEGKVKVISESILNFKTQNLSNYDLVILNNAGKISSVVKERLDKYLLKGGKVLIFLGNNTDPIAYNTLLGGLLPGKIGEILLDGKITNSIYQEIDLGEISLFKLYRITPSEKASILATLHPHTKNFVVGVNQQYPGLLQQNYLEGKVILCSFCDQQEWSDIFIHPAYPVLIQKMVRDLCVPAVTKQWLVGDIVHQPMEDKEVDVVDPAGNSERVQIPAFAKVADAPKLWRLSATAGRQTANFVYTSTYLPGIYKIHSKDKLLDYFAVNIDPQETDLRTMNLERIKKLAIPLSGTVSPEERGSLPVAQVSVASSQLVVESEPKHLELWQIVLLIGILLFIIESWAQNLVYRTK